MSQAQIPAQVPRLGPNLGTSSCRGRDSEPRSGASVVAPRLVANTTWETKLENLRAFII
jgi:hypothetical protein